MLNRFLTSGYFGIFAVTGSANYIQIKYLPGVDILLNMDSIL